MVGFTSLAIWLLSSANADLPDRARRHWLTTIAYSCRAGLSCMDGRDADRERRQRQDDERPDLAADASLMMRASRRTLLIGAMSGCCWGRRCGRLIGEGVEARPGVVPRSRARGNVQAFVDSLGAGDVGARAGAHRPDLKVKPGGSPTAPLTVRSYPGERATIKTPSIYVPPTSKDVHLDSLNGDGEHKVGITMQLNGDRVELTNSDITNHHTAESCINLGYSRSWTGGQRKPHP